jgi:hypothetical protein
MKSGYLTNEQKCDTLVSVGNEKGRGGEEMGTTKTFWGCPKCKREFTEGITPHHVRTFMDLSSPKVFESPCDGSGEKTVRIDRQTRRRLK